MRKPQKKDILQEKHNNLMSRLEYEPTVKLDLDELKNRDRDF